MDQQIAKALRLRLNQRSNVAAAREKNARAGLCQIYDCESNEQRERRNDFKVQQCFRAHTADLFQITTAGDADDEGGKNQGGYDRLDKVKKNVAQEIDIVAPLGTDITEHSADHQADENLRGQ